MTDRNEPSPSLSTLLAHNEVGQIHVDQDGVVTLKISYVSLRLQAEAFDALSTLVQHAAVSLKSVQANPTPEASSASAMVLH